MIFYSEGLRKAARMAYVAHDEQFDRGNVPYIYHPMAVAQRIYEEIKSKTDDEKTIEEYVITALLHDVVEDSYITFEQLSCHFSKSVIIALRALTRKQGESYFNYIQRVDKIEMAKAIKLCDLKENMDLRRIPNPNNYDMMRKQKYEMATQWLLTKNKNAEEFLRSYK